jgi:hypothetical protein
MRQEKSQFFFSIFNGLLFTLEKDSIVWLGSFIGLSPYNFFYDLEVLKLIYLNQYGFLKFHLSIKYFFG